MHDLHSVVTKLWIPNWKFWNTQLNKTVIHCDAQLKMLIPNTTKKVVHVYPMTSNPYLELCCNVLKFWISLIQKVASKKHIDVNYRKFPKYSDTQNICCNHSQSWTMWLYHRVMSPKDAEGMANSVDPLGAVWSEFALFAQTCLSENLGSLR